MRAQPLLWAVLGSSCCIPLSLPGSDDPPEPPPVALAPTVAAPPVLDPAPTGSHTGDDSLTVDRCVRTSWSYFGCDDAFPVQGRRWLAYDCETARTRPVAYIGNALDGDELDDRTLEREVAQLRELDDRTMEHEVTPPHGERPAGAPTDQDRYRAVVCGRWAEYRIRGVGGPVEREAGMGTLEQLCNEGHLGACGSLAEVVLWDDVERARTLTERACGDPDESPAGKCELLRDATSGGMHSYDVTLTEASGLGLSAGQTCRAWVIRRTAREQPFIVDADRCDARVQCGELVLYGDGGSVCPCSLSRGALRAGESMLTGEDGDAAFSIDARAHTFSLRDDAAGTHGAFALRGTIRSR